MLPENVPLYGTIKYDKRYVQTEVERDTDHGTVSYLVIETRNIVNYCCHYCHVDLLLNNASHNNDINNVLLLLFFCFIFPISISMKLKNGTFLQTCSQSIHFVETLVYGCFD